jgi:hypothetical protein
LSKVFPSEEIFFSQPRNHQRGAVNLPRTGVADSPELAPSGLFVGVKDFPNQIAQ